MKNDFNKTIEFFNEMSNSWDEREKATKDDLRKFLSFLPVKKGDKVLDVACGTGIISDILSELSNAPVLAIDISDKMIEIAKAKSKNDNVVFENINFFDIKDSYDDVIVFNAYPHFVDTISFVNHAKDIVCENGYLVIAHNLSRSALNKHHAALSQNISRSLEPVEIEYSYFKNYFESLILIDDETKYIMVLKRKES